jgi:hypothetical protein
MLLPAVDALKALADARSAPEAEQARRFAEHVTELTRDARVVFELPHLTPEQRVHEFDRVLAAIGATSISARERLGLTLVAAYIVTVAAGGSASLALAEPTTQRWPEITAWAYVVGSVGERVVWTSSFDGLARLVARELMRPLRLDEPPTSDFSLNEALALIDGQLSDPLVHLRIKQSRMVAVSIRPGVIVYFPLAEHSVHDASTPQQRDEREPAKAHRAAAGEDPVAALADAFYPYIRDRLRADGWLGLPDDEAPIQRRSYQRPRTGKRSGQQKLPLKS